MKRALVTGSAGFIGRHMVEELERRGYAVDGADLTDCIDAHQVFRSPITPRYDLVVHAAYHVGGRAAIDGVNTNFARNVALDGAMFDWAVRTRQRKVLYFSSSAVYPVKYQTSKYFTTHPHRALREADVNPHEPMLPDKGYGWAKLTGERLAEDAEFNGLPITVVRPASGCSAHQDPTYPFPAIAARVALKDAPVRIWGPQGQARDFVHVTDVIGAALAICDASAIGPVNICTGVATEMGTLATKLWKKMHPGTRGFTLFYDTSQPTGVYRRVLDPKLMLNYYQPKWTLDAMVDEAAEVFE